MICKNKKDQFLSFYNVINNFRFNEEFFFTFSNPHITVNYHMLEKPIFLLTYIELLLSIQEMLISLKVLTLTVALSELSAA